VQVNVYFVILADLRLDSAGIPVTKERRRNSSRRVRSSWGTFLDGILSADRLQTSRLGDAAVHQLRRAAVFAGWSAARPIDERHTTGRITDSSKAVVPNAKMITINTGYCSGAAES
jgi:hypothetical protein